MINFNKRSYSPELLDADVIPQADLFQNLKELKIINTLLGGHRVVLNGIKHFAKSSTNLRVVEIGSGGEIIWERFTKNTPILNLKELI